MTLTVIDHTAQTSPDCYDDRPLGTPGRISACLLHHTGGTDSLLWLSGHHGVSVHKLLAKDGTIYKIVPETKRAWHAGVSEWAGRYAWNDFSIGYELENLGNGYDQYTPAQYDSLAHTLAYDCALYHIPDFWIKDHREVALPRGRKSDPDPTFDHEVLWSKMATIRANWPYAPALKEWHC